jgi:hypothetical protein
LLHRAKQDRNKLIFTEEMSRDQIRTSITGAEEPYARSIRWSASPDLAHFPHLVFLNVLDKE